MVIEIIKNREYKNIKDESGLVFLFNKCSKLFGEEVSFFVEDFEIEPVYEECIVEEDEVYFKTKVPLVNRSLSLRGSEKDVSKNRSIAMNISADCDEVDFDILFLRAVFLALLSDNGYILEELPADEHTLIKNICFLVIKDKELSFKIADEAVKERI